ncbi:MAG: FG-GAP repeat domain-containing protein [Planctomycetota bacterium]
MLNSHMAGLWAAICLLGQWTVAGDLLEPRPVKVGDEILDVEHSGHAAPFAGDFDGDGRRDLLVGEYYQGQLRIYRNVGTNSEPRFDGYHLFQDGARSGRIHAS